MRFASYRDDLGKDGPVTAARLVLAVLAPEVSGPPVGHPAAAGAVIGETAPLSNRPMGTQD